MSLNALVDVVADHNGILPSAVSRGGRKPGVAEARALFCVVAARVLGYSGVEVGGVLGMTRAGVSAAVRRSESGLAEEVAGVEKRLVEDS